MMTATTTCVFAANEHLLGADGLLRHVSFYTAAARIHPAQSSNWIWQRTKFMLRAWQNPGYTRAWLSRLVQPDVSDLWVLRPRLATKLQRPYLGCDWEVPERCAALLGHYEALPRLLAPAIRSDIYKHGTRLLRIQQADSSLQLDIRLFYQDQFEKEGELTLAVVDVATGLLLAGLTFSLVQFDGRRTLILGGVQGSPDQQARNTIHACAKAMYGLRAKALALWCVQELAACWRVQQIQAVGSDQHIYRHRHKQREISANYDEFWSESDGLQLSGGGWELPLCLRERSRNELKASRRKAHECRYRLLARLREELQPMIKALSPESFRTHFSSAEIAVFTYTKAEIDVGFRERAAPHSECNSMPSL